MNLQYLKVIFLFFSLLQNTVSKKQLISLEGDNFDKVLKSAIQTKSKLFIIFYIDDCPYCSKAIKVLKESIINKYDDINTINFCVANLESPSNIWLSVRFNITRIPHIILIENKRMYHFQNQFEESIVLKFIEEKKLKEDSLDIPQNVGIMNKIHVFIEDLTEKINDSIRLVFYKFGIKVYWHNSMTYILLGFCFIIIIYLENKLVLGIKKIYKFSKYGKKENYSINDIQKNNGNADRNKNGDGKEVSEDKKEKKE